MTKLNTLRSLGSLFHSSIKSTPATTTTSAAAAAKTSPAVDKSLKHFLSPLDHGGIPSEDALEVPWFSDLSNYCTCPRRKLSRERKEKWALKRVQVNHDIHLVDEFRKIGRKIRMKEFNALLKICIENASTTDNETVALEQVSKAFEVFMSMKEEGFPIEEESYGQVLLYLIDRGMVEQFHLFTDVIKDGSASTLARLGYYEKLVYTRVNDGEKDVVSRAVVDGGDC